MLGEQIGSYLVERKLGEGGMGVVYVGVDVRLGRRAAIKQLLPELSGQREIVERFFNEAKAAASINHPGIVEIYDVGWHSDGSAYFAMKLLDGESLSRRMRSRGPMPVRVAVTVVRQVASALAAAHARGIVHRDLKPDNIVLVPDDEAAIGERATVLDFGIAKLFGDQVPSQKTRTGSVMGTPVYMSPEQCRGSGEVDHRTDVYALGCILFESLTGRPPFVAEGAGELLGMHQFVEPPTVRSLRADVPPALDALVTRSLAKRPEHRPQTMAEMIAALQELIGPDGRSMEMAAAAPGFVGTFGTAPPWGSHAGVSVVPVNSTLSAGRGQMASTVGHPPRRWPLIAGGLLAVAGIAAAVALVAGGSGTSENGGAAASSTAAVSASTTTMPAPPTAPALSTAAPAPAPIPAAASVAPAVVPAPPPAAEEPAIEVAPPEPPDRAERSSRRRDKEKAATTEKPATTEKLAARTAEVSPAPPVAEPAPPPAAPPAPEAEPALPRVRDFASHYRGAVSEGRACMVASSAHPENLLKEFSKVRIIVAPSGEVTGCTIVDGILDNANRCFCKPLRAVKVPETRDGGQMTFNVKYGS